MASSVDADSRSFLLSCLSIALGQTEVLVDIADVAGLSAITARTLASGDLTVASAAEKLYLTESEAIAVLEVCKQQVSLLDGPTQAADVETGITLVLTAGESDSSVVVQMLSQPQPPSPSSGQEDEDQQSQEDEELQFDSAAEDCAADEDAESLPSPSRLVPQLESVVEEEAAALAAPVPIDSNFFGGGSPSSLHVPSYLRPTASSKRQTKKEREAAAAQELKPVSSPKAASPSKKGSNVFARLGHTLLAPTATFLARVTGKAGSELSADPAHSKSVGSRMLDKVLDSPQGQRVTRPSAFRLAVDSRPKAQLVSSDDLVLAKAQEQTFKPHTVPKHVHEVRPLEFRAASSPRDPQEIFVPFQLASAERHTQQQEEQRAKAAAEQSADQASRRFRAVEWSKDMVGVQSPTTPAKPAALALTVAKGPVFASDERIAHYHTVVEPVKKAKEAEANREKLEEERQARELQELSVLEFRKTLDFKATRLPDFSAPFRYDATLSASPTATQAFVLNTTARLGDARPLSAREDLQGHRLAFGDGAFAASLRASGGSSPTSPAALRRSTQAPLARSVNNSPLSASAAKGGPAARAAGACPSPSSPTSAARKSPAASASSPRAGASGAKSNLRASLQASLAQGLAEAKMAAAAKSSADAASLCVAQESTSRRSTHDSLPSSPRVMAL